MKLIFVHGRAQEAFDELELKNKWINDWEVGLQKSGLTKPKNLQIEFPYYGKILVNLIDEAKTIQTKIEAIRSTVLQNDAKEIAFVKAFLEEIAESIAANREEKAMLNEYKITTRSWKEDSENFHKILEFIDKKGVLGTLPIELMTKDVFMYLSNRHIKNSTNEKVASVFDKEPSVVVGHSLGSVVSYLVLKNNPNYHIKKFITIGSPLGVNVIRPFLEQPIEMPTCVKNGWFNAFDPRDIVSLYPLDKKHFNIMPAIENKNNVDNCTENRYSIEGYLNDSEVAKRIYEALF